LAHIAVQAASALVALETDARVIELEDGCRLNIANRSEFTADRLVHEQLTNLVFPETATRKFQTVHSRAVAAI
jgi:hypothetical protein